MGATVSCHRVPEPPPSMVLLLSFLLAVAFVCVIRGCELHEPPPTRLSWSP